MEQTTTSMQDIQLEQLQQENRAWRAKFEGERNEKLQLVRSASQKDRLVNELQKEVEAQKKIISELPTKLLQVTDIRTDEIKNYVDEITPLRLATNEKDGKINTIAWRTTEAQHAIHRKEANKSVKQKTSPDAKLATKSNYEASRAKWLQIDVESQFKKSPKKHEKGWCPEDSIAISKLSSGGEYPKKVRSPTGATASSSTNFATGSHPVMSMFAKHAANIAHNRNSSRFPDTNKIVRKEDQGKIVKSSVVPLDAGRTSTSLSAGKGSDNSLAFSAIHIVTVEPQDLDTPCETDLHLRLFSHQQKEIIGLGIDMNESMDSKHSPVAIELVEPSPIQKAQSQAVPTSASTEPKVTINISHADQKNWTLLQRAQSFLTKTSKLEILGTNEHVEAFTIGLNKTMVEQAEQANAVKHWESLALRSLTEVDILRLELNSRPSCVIPAHRSLTDELEAKNLRLEMQTILVADLQNKFDLVHTIDAGTNADKKTDNRANH